MSIPGSNIRLLRKQLGLSLKSLAQSASMDHGNLSKLERGEAGYSKEAVERVAKVLNVSVGVLFAEEGVVEVAAAKMRIVPVLNAEQLLRWKGADSLALSDDHRHLRADMSRMSRHVFAFVYEDPGDGALAAKGDEMIFDAGRQPSRNAIVATQDPSGNVFIGRFRPLTRDGHDGPSFEVLCIEPRGTSVSTDTHPGLQIKGARVETRRYDQ